MTNQSWVGELQIKIDSNVSMVFKKYTENLDKDLYLTNIITAKVCDSGCLLVTLSRHCKTDLSETQYLLSRNAYYIIFYLDIPMGFEVIRMKFQDTVSFS